MFVFSYLSHFQSLLFKIIHNSNYPVCFKLEIRKKKCARYLTLWTI